MSERIDQLYRDSFRITLAGASGAIQERQGSIFNRANSLIFQGNMKSSNWNARSFIYQVEARLKRLTHHNFITIVPSTYPDEQDPSLPVLLKELLDNIYITSKINAKEYFVKVPLYCFCNPIGVHRGRDISQDSDDPSWVPSYGVTENLKVGSGGIWLNDPIELAPMDVLELVWQFGPINVDTMPFYTAMSAASNFEWNYTDLEVDQYIDDFSFDVEIVLKGTEDRIEQ